MVKRLAITGAAAVVAAALLLVTLLSGPRAAERREQNPTPPGQVELPRASAPPEHGADLRRNPPVAGSRTGRIGGPSKEGYVVVEYQELTPRSQGVSDIVGPRTLVFLAQDGSEVLEMTAAEGTVHAPDNRPRSGELRGNVILTLRDTQGRGPVDLKSGRDVQLVIYLDDAHFDLELGEVRSDGPVFLTGPSVEFKGAGLGVNFNQLRNRLDRLEVATGESLRFRGDRAEAASRPAAAPAPEPKAPAADQPEDPTQAAAPREKSPGPVAEAPRSDDATPAAEAPAAPSPPRRAQFYRARFERDVKAVTQMASRGDAPVEMTGDELVAIFSLEGDDLDDDTDAEADTNGTTKTDAAPRGDKPRRQRDAAANTGADDEGVEPADTSLGDTIAPPPQLTGQAQRRSLMPPRDNDVVITWAGRLIIEPEPGRPADLTGPDDALLALQGAPTTVKMGEDSVTGVQVDYLLSSGRVRARGSEETPMRLQSAELGDLSGTSLTIDPSAGRGEVIGPGQLRGDFGRGGDDAKPREPLQVAWGERLDLDFYLGEARHEGPRRLRAIRSATFRGDVSANHPRFNLDSHALTIALDAPMADDTDQAVRAIEASGDVAFAARNTRDEPFEVQGQTLRIGMRTADDGESVPHELLVEGEAQLRREGMEMAAGRVEATLQDAPASAATATGEGFDIERLVARDNVQVALAEHELTLTGERLTVDGATRLMELFGSADAPATAAQPEGTLYGERLIVNEAAQTLQVITPGRIALYTLPNNPDATLDVAWKGAMRYDGKAGTGDFTGGVTANTRSTTDTTTLLAPELHLELEQHSEAPDDETAKDAPNMRAQRIRRAIARDDARFDAVAFEPNNPEAVQLRFRLEGPLMVFDNTPELQQVQVVGKGRMFIDDLRPPKTEQPAQRPAASGPARTADLVKVSGRGATLFEWQRSLTMDATRNDLTLVGNVTMVHRPAKRPGQAAGSEEPVHFFAQRLVADMSETGGLGAWMNDSGPQMNIAGIQADVGVVIQRGGMTAMADHLRYDASTGKVVLSADRGKRVQINIEGEPPINSEVVTWDLNRDRFELGGFGGATVPVR